MKLSMWIMTTTAVIALAAEPAAPRDVVARMAAASDGGRVALAEAFALAPAPDLTPTWATLLEGVIVGRGDAEVRARSLALLVDLRQLPGVEPTLARLAAGGAGDLAARLRHELR